MKYLSLLFVTLVMSIVTAGCCCHVNPANYTHPAGYQSCTTDADCKGPGHDPGEFCGFISADTYAVCRK